ncbi:G2/mitotic-specific cyclin-B3 [Agrilus planipennis]|uniref:G2/mitotic-specific cyclin-B3 n=1 Tax=Agrilus planipennis TaxID=224129 RepID=A0A1W4WNA3_AGRPL|nr:G2/mitotic-specific cyclin-B3 [Agrilus planipennis]
MAPTRATKPELILAVGAKRVNTNAISTRSKSTIINVVKERAKRKADGSPPKENGVKRSAFGDITNALKKTKETEIKGKTIIKVPNAAKKVKVQAKVLPTVRTVNHKKNENTCPPPAPVNNKPRTRATQRLHQPNQTVQKPKEVLKDNTNVNQKIKTRLSNEFEKTEESLYSTAIDINISNCNSSTVKSNGSKIDQTEENDKGIDRLSKVSFVAQQLEKKLTLNSYCGSPEGIDDFDKENWNDPFQVSHYAMDIFNYLKERESYFTIKDYMDHQIHLSCWMRTLLIDWMVEIQESFELNHETLYLGVKLVDLYLSKVIVSRDDLQLVGVASIFIASKFDERIPPSVDDFVYICDSAYDRRKLLRMEMNILKVIDFDLGIPLSYRFLRRYARCAKVNMPTLTLARFILEYSLMDYAIVTLRDSKLAAAALYIALKMKNISGWTPTLEYYTGYTLMEFIDIARLLNNGLHQKPKEQIMTVRNKYSHKIFFHVAKTPLVPTEDL